MAPTFLLLALMVISTSVDDADAKIIDLSHVHKPSTFVYQGYPNYTRSAVIQGEWVPGIYLDNGYITAAEHSGTHIDVPSHFVKGGKSLSEVTVEMTIAEGVMIDCAAETEQNPLYELTVQKLEEWELHYGRIPDEAAIVINFGWSKYFEDPVAYRGSETTFLFPFIGDAAARWLLEKRNAKMLCTDTLSPDPMDPSLGQMGSIHLMYLPLDKVIVENLKDPGRLPPRNFRFFATPVKYEGSTGTQVRAFAVTYDEDIFFNEGTTVRPGLASVVALAIVTLFMSF